ncbi:hypothetical protein [Streptomyces sp. NPDC005181]|uniref:hypothetical protein n=1 Tax=Streptomyces sp. NPDC005181 TaxID=3156869 RepID=UPI0033BDBB2C
MDRLAPDDRGAHLRQRVLGPGRHHQGRDVPHEGAGPRCGTPHAPVTATFGALTEPLALGSRTAATRWSSSGTSRDASRSPSWLFVTERREFRQHGRTCLVEEQDIVYRSGRSARQHPTGLDESAFPDTDAQWQLPLRPDPALLFRFSALTANAHRIHYDTPYCQGEEGYPGLVVHGPLLALLMLELVRRHAPARQVSSLSYRLRRPVFAGERLTACGTPSDGHAELHVATHREARHAMAEVTFA